MERSPFQILQLPDTATADEIKLSYRRLVALYHPDNNPGFPEEATEKVRELNEAYTQARAGWKPPVGTVPGTYSPRPPHHNPPRVWDPPTPVPKPKGPKVPPARYADVPPPRSGPPKARADDEAAGLDARRRALVDDLTVAGFLTPPVDPTRGHAVVDAFLPLYATGDRLLACGRYARHVAHGPVPPEHHHHEFLHAVPSLAIGGIQARQEAVDRIVRGQFVACTRNQLIWTVSAFVDSDGILMPEDIAVHAVPRSAITSCARRRGDVRLLLAGGVQLGFGLERHAAERLEDALASS